MTVEQTSSRTTGNDSVEGVDPGGTRSTKPGNPDKSAGAEKGSKLDQKVESGDRNANPGVDAEK